MPWSRVLREGDLSHSAAIDELGGPQPVPLSLWAQGSHLTVGIEYLPHRAAMKQVYT